MPTTLALNITDSIIFTHPASSETVSAVFKFNSTTIAATKTGGDWVANSAYTPNSAGRHDLFVQETFSNGNILSTFIYTIVVRNPSEQTFSRQLLSAVEASLKGVATHAQQSVSVGGRSLSRYSIVELYDLRKKLKTEIAAERNKSAVTSRRVEL